MAPPAQRPFDEEELRRLESELDKGHDKAEEGASEQDTQHEADEDEVQKEEDGTRE